VRRLLIPEATLVLSIGLAACQQTPPPEPIATTPISDNTSFHSCVDREAKAALERAITRDGDNVLYGYTVGINNDIISVCKGKPSNESLYSRDVDYLYVDGVVEPLQTAALHAKADKEVGEERKKEELDAPRIKAEKAEEDEAGTTYAACLLRHAKILSLNSNEPAEVIVQASFPSCSAERQAVFDVYQRHNSYFSQGVMNAMEGVFRQNLLLEVIKGRAQRVAPPESQPTKPETPI